MSEPLLRVEHLCQYFGPNKAVDDVSFEIQKGEVFGLVGESGCGKTTTGRSIIKLYDITSGSIYFKGKRIAAGTKSYKDRIRENVLLTLLFAVCTQLFMQIGRACVSFLSGAPIESGLHFITTDALSGLFTMVIVWIASRLDGVFEDQISYLLRVQAEAREEKGGF